MPLLIWSSAVRVLLFLDQHHAQIDVRIAQVGLDLDRHVEVGRGSLDMAELVQHHPAIVIGGGQVLAAQGLPLDRQVAGADAVKGPAGLGMDETVMGPAGFLGDDDLGACRAGGGQRGGQEQDLKLHAQLQAEVATRILHPFVAFARGCLAGRSGTLFAQEKHGFGE